VRLRLLRRDMEGLVLGELFSTFRGQADVIYLCLVPNPGKSYSSDHCSV